MEPVPSHDQFVASRQASKKRILELKCVLKSLRHTHAQFDKACLDTTTLATQYQQTFNEFVKLKRQREADLMAYLSMLRQHVPEVPATPMS